VLKNTDGKPTGYTQNVSYNIVDVGAMAADPAYLADINAQYDAVFLDPKTNSALKQQYLLDLAENQGEMKDGKFVGDPALDWNDLSKMDPAEARKLVTNAMVKHQWTGYFPKQFGEKVALTQVELEEGSALLERAIEQNLRNPLTGDVYKAGEEVYVTRAAGRTYRDPDAKQGSKGNSDFQVRLRILNNKINEAANNEDVLQLFDTVQQTPGQETFLLLVGDKVKEVKKNPETKEWDEVANSIDYTAAKLKSIYKGY